MKKPAVATSVTVFILVFTSTETFGVGGGSEHTVSLGLLALGATARPSSYSGEYRRLLLAVLGAALVVVTTEVSSVPTVVAVVAVSGVVAGEVAATAVEDEASGAFVFSVVGGFVGAGAGVLTIGSVSVPVVATTAFAVLAAITARSTGASIWLTVVVAGFGGWTAAVVEPSGSVVFLVGAAVFVVALAVGAYVADAMTVSGATAGALLSYVVLVAGGVGWFVVLGVFVVTGSATTAYGRDTKEEIGLAEHDEGRGFRNVFANGVVAFVAVVVHAVSSSPTVESFALLGFVGCMATATADTASSEIGSVTGDPRLITTLERVPPGTDGGVSWQGEVLTFAASVAVGVVAYAVGVLSVEYAAVAALSGIVGAHADSVLGATVEGWILDNEGVNLSACAVGAMTAGTVGYLV